MKTFIALILFLLIAPCLWSQNAADTVQSAYPLTYDVIRIKAIQVWVSLYDEQQQQTQDQCAAVTEFLAITVKYSDTLQDVYAEARTKAFNRYAEKYWQNCDETNLDNWMACVNPDWVKVVTKMKKIFNRKLHSTDLSMQNQ